MEKSSGWRSVARRLVREAEHERKLRRFQGSSGPIIPLPLTRRKRRRLISLPNFIRD